MAIEVRFVLDDEQSQETALEMAAEMGLTVDELALSAFGAYLDGVREAMSWDLDETTG